MFKKYQLINIARNQLGMDDDSYRAMINRINGGKGTSLKDCNMAELNLILKELKAKGFKVKPVKAGGFKSRRVKQPKTTNDGLPLPADIRDKMLSLWIEMHQQGIIRDGSDAALTTYCRNRTGKDHWHWITEWEAIDIIEGLKTWQSRELLGRLLKRLKMKGITISKVELDNKAEIKRAKTLFKYTATENWRVIDKLCHIYDIEI
ncbi:hypothetical protein DC081_08945 [Ignatzschineria cameli]|uniref:gp16 family protein n=1 Tax=Ignatzschineria cameli TaxID=2182793 RepID=UPI000D61B238|nr:regulatory protein GemA [Ignatzschineria cameli]PWD89566.1 hypothetical protein DC081_08945 [Ignatzschineria cameli]